MMRPRKTSREKSEKKREPRVPLNRGKKEETRRSQAEVKNRNAIDGGSLRRYTRKRGGGGQIKKEKVPGIIRKGKARHLSRVPFRGG